MKRVGVLSQLQAAHRLKVRLQNPCVAAMCTIYAVARNPPLAWMNHLGTISYDVMDQALLAT